MSDMDLPTTAGADAASFDYQQQDNNDIFAAYPVGFFDHDPTANIMASQKPSQDPWSYNDSSFSATGFAQAHLQRSLTASGFAQDLTGFNVDHESSSTTHNHYSSKSPGITASHEANSATESPPSDMMPSDLFDNEHAFNSMSSPFEYSNSHQDEENDQKHLVTSSTEQPQPHAKAPLGLQTPSPSKSASSTKSSDQEFYDQKTYYFDEKTGSHIEDTFGKLNELVPAARKYVKEQLKKWRMSNVEPLSKLKTVPKQKGETDGDCATCAGKVKLNGNNDGIHCTRCFNRINKQKELEYGLRLTLAERGIKSKRGLNEPIKSSKQHAKLQPTGASVGDGFDVFAGASKTTAVSGMPSHMIDFYAGNGYEDAGGDFNAHYDNAILSSSFEDENHYGNQAQAYTKTNGFTLPTSVRFKTEQEARNHLANPPREACQHIDFANDDWEQVKYELLDGFVIQLISVLPIPGSIPPGMDKKQRTTYETKHANRLGKVQACLRDPDELMKVEARARLLMDEVVRIHEVGVPQSAYARLSQGSNRGSCYKPELELICSARARTVIELASQSKYIALDICEGNNFEIMAMAPEKYFAKKVANSNSNGRREGRNDAREGRGDAPKKGKSKKAKKLDDSNKVDPLIGDGPSNFDNAYAPPSNGYQSYSVPAWGPYMPAPVPQPSYNIFSHPAPTTTGAGGKRKHPYGLDDELSAHDSKRSKFGNEGGYGEGFEFN